MADTTSSNATPPTASTDDRTGYDPITGTFHARFDTDGHADAIVVTIVETVAAVTDHDPTEMPPLFAIVDSEALSTLVASAAGSHLEVTFEYEGCHVAVSSAGDVVVEMSDG